MSNDETGGDLCKGHSARRDKDYYRICPSKLSKRELEDLYYSVLENNMDLKRNVNNQNEKIRTLSTKLQRLTAQRNTIARDPKECCGGAKAIINEQKTIIADLKRANDCMAERIKCLNMRLCTAKQFLKRSPTQSANRCYKCFSAASTSVKILSTTDLQNKSSNVNLKTNALSTQTSLEVVPIQKNAETNTSRPESDTEKMDTEKICDENKCRSTMEELKQKIIDLQEELSKTHEEHSTRMAQLETQVAALRAASLRARTERSPRALESLTQANREKADLETQLLIEKKKVAEMETRLKAAELSREVAKTIEEHRNTSQQLEARQRASLGNEKCNICVTPCEDSCKVSQSTLSKALTGLTVPEKKPSKMRLDRADDSGYADSTLDSGRTDTSATSVNQELVKRIAYLQAQLDTIKSTSTEEKYSTPHASKPEHPKVYLVGADKPDVMEQKADKDYACVSIDPVEKVQVEIEHITDGITKLEVEPVKPDDKTANRLSHIHNNEDVNVNSKENLVEPLKTRLRLQSASDASRPARRLTIELKETDHNENPESDHLLLNDANAKEKAVSGQEESIGYSKDSAPRNVHSVEINNNTCVEKSKPLEVSFNANKVSLLEALEVHKDREAVVNTCIEPSRKTAQTNTSRKIYTKCECVKCNLPLKNESLGHKLDGHQFFDNATSQPVFESNNQDELNTTSKISQKPKTRSDNHNSMQIPGPLPVNTTDSGASKRSKGSKSVSLNENNANIGGMREDKERVNSIEEEINFGSTKMTERSSRICKSADSKEHNDVKPIVTQPIIEHVTQPYSGSKNTEMNKTYNFDKKGAINVDDFDTTSSVYHGDFCISRSKTDNRLKKEISFSEHFKSADGGNVKDHRKDFSLNDPLNTMNHAAEFANVDNEEGNENIKQKIEMRSLIKSAVPSKSIDVEKASNSSAGNTYRISSPETEAYSRATSPDNTDNEISHLTDLPTEREDTTPFEALSPGERKRTPTFRNFYSPRNEQLLSEGEVPYDGKNIKRRQSISVGEHPGDPASKKLYPPETSAHKMEAALQAISLELARCRSLLESQRSRELRSSKDASSTADLEREASISLRKVEGTPTINGTWTPKCIFVLHIGAVVLSDEAVINSRNANLMLTWKFYDQNVAMTRMKAGRVVHFDFSTEYEIKITEDFVNYLKHDEMPISICEIDGAEKIFATCALPLREALLNANRRADLSLELVAGPQLLRSQDTLDTSDEVGVLDLWCMLRAEPKNLAVINCHIDKGLVSRTEIPSFHEARPSQMMEDDASNDVRLSQDLNIDMHMNMPMKEASKLTTSVEEDKISCSTTHYIHEPEKLEKIITSTTSNKPVKPLDLQNTLVPHHNKIGSPSVTSNLDMNSTESKAISSDRKPLTHNKQSGIIFSEVTPSRRMPSEMKDIWDQPGSRRGSLDKFNGHALHYPEHRPSKLTNVIETQPSEYSHKTDIWRSTKTHAPVKDIAVTQKISNLSDIKLSLPKKYQDSVQSIDTTKKVTIAANHELQGSKRNVTEKSSLHRAEDQTLDITVLWLALNEECEAMLNPSVRRLYVAYSFLGRDGAELETPVSLPKPKHYIDKCYYNFRKSFHLTEFDMPILEHMAKCRSHTRNSHNSKDCIVFAVVSEPPEDNPGTNCEDIGCNFTKPPYADPLPYDLYMEVYKNAQGHRLVRGNLTVPKTIPAQDKRGSFAVGSEGPQGIRWKLTMKDLNCNSFVAKSILEGFGISLKGCAIRQGVYVMKDVDVDDIDTGFLAAPARTFGKYVTKTSIYSKTETLGCWVTHVSVDHFDKRLG